MTLTRGIVPFERTLSEHGLRVERRPLEILQVNVGKRCNQACRHCHVDAGPARTEEMDARTAERLLELLAASRTVHTVDVTGGAPELNPSFRRLVSESRRLGREVIDRCNLTVLLVEGQEDTARFLRDHAVRVVASLPCYTADNVDRQRGGDVFEKSIRALRMLNDLGYGRPGGGLVLDLVYNPLGPSLPPDQKALESDYRMRLRADFGIEFNHLLTLANMPINRFRAWLERSDRLQGYMDLLVSRFNPRAAEGVMCRDLLSVSWDGRLYDCDFNQMLDVPPGGAPRTLWDLTSLDEVDAAPIRFGDHCYGCTAGAGSSCGGQLT